MVVINLCTQKEPCLVRSVVEGQAVVKLNVQLLGKLLLLTELHLLMVLLLGVGVAAGGHLVVGGRQMAGLMVGVGVGPGARGAVPAVTLERRPHG